MSTKLSINIEYNKNGSKSASLTVKRSDGVHLLKDAKVLLPSNFFEEYHDDMWLPSKSDLLQEELQNVTASTVDRLFLSCEKLPNNSAVGSEEKLLIEKCNLEKLHKILTTEEWLGEVLIDSRVGTPSIYSKAVLALSSAASGVLEATTVTLSSIVHGLQDAASGKTNEIHGNRRGDVFVNSASKVSPKTSALKNH